MIVNIINSSNNPLPAYSTPASAGCDLRANLESPLRLMLGDRAIIPTGIKLEIPEGYEAQVRPRSGNFIKLGLYVALGTIDADYRGEVGVMVINLGHEGIEINNGDRIGQLVFNKVEQADWSEVKELSETERGEGGFGHTGTK